MSSPDEYELIDRHLAGVLRPEEEERLEMLIRTSPDWAHRYREAEEMARLLRNNVGPGGVPPQRLMQIQAETAKAAPLPARSTTTTWSQRKWLVAAALLVALTGAYLFFPGVIPGGGDDVVSLVYADEPLPLKDLARLSTVGVVGQVVQQQGMLGLRVEDTLFGSAEGIDFALPTDLHPGQRVALFARPADNDMYEVVGNRRGIVHLDGIQRWAGRRLHPRQSRALVEQAASLRTLESALTDLQAFLATDASLAMPTAPNGLGFSGAVTAGFLGQFEIRHIREDLLRLLVDMNKDPAARSSAGVALVTADPTGSCREIMRRVMQGRPHLLRAESEDGQVVLTCLELMRQHGPQDLVADLSALANAVECRAIRQAADDTAKAVAGDGPRTGRFMRGVPPRRLREGDEEALVLSGCEGQKKGLLVVFRNSETVASLRLPVNLAVGEGLGVLVLPPQTRDVQRWIQAAVDTGIVSSANLRYLGIGRAAADALAAASVQVPQAVYLMAELGQIVPGGLDDLKKASNTGFRAHVFANDIDRTLEEGIWRLHPTPGGPASWLANETLLGRVLTTD